MYVYPLRRLCRHSDATLTLHGLATNYLSNVVDTGLSPAVDTAGSNGSLGPPGWIYRASATYDTPRFSVTGVARGISAGTYANSYVQCTSGCPAYSSFFPTIDRNHIAGTFYVDANITAKIHTTRIGYLEVFLNVTNLFDAHPILLPESGLAANSTYSDLIGRMVRGGLRFELP